MPLNALNVKERAETHFQYKVYTMEKSLNWPYESGGPHDEIGIFLECTTRLRFIGISIKVNEKIKLYSISLNP